MLKYLSLFSGIAADTVAWKPLGFIPVAFAEIDSHASKLLAEKYPDVPNLGDVTLITEQDIKALGHIDIIIFGSPCQNLSVAGNRKGLEGDQSVLFRTAIRIVEWARQHCGLRFALWENVVGAFSTNEGRDFSEVVGTLAGLKDVSPPPNKWGKEGAAVGDYGLVEWGVLDSQWFGLAQRRKRVFAIADFGDWFSRPPILLERESMRGTPPSRTATGENTAKTTRDSTETASTETNAYRLVSFGEYVGDGYASTLKARDYKDATDLVVTPVTYCIQANNINSNGNNVNVDISFTLNTVDHHIVAYSFDSLASNSMNSSNPYSGCREVECAKTLDTTIPTPTKNQGGIGIVQNLVIRRLTVVECERLMGFPDNYTETLSINQRYRVLGNSMAVPVVEWIGKQIINAVSY